ncbi:RE1-silencing transcription factor A [Drosophila elegans]|uniref:RE1-silencing transcription factor A n=1 Tax=Drosophila elegans TaxID=30023 RepID=UPI0007E6FCB8|nr:RE1-silencing transcription factor A [Drosophila elegans]
MSQPYEATETLTIEALDFMYQDEMEFLDIKPPPENQDNPKPAQIKRLMCNINGCNYATNRRRDLKRHKRTQKHVLEKFGSEDSESDDLLEPSLFSCPLCDYTTAKRFSYVRHKESRRHIRKELDECEKLMDKADKAEGPMKHRKRVEEPVDMFQNTDAILYTYDYNTTEKSCLETHKNTVKHRKNHLEANEFIEYVPQAEEFAETEDEYDIHRKGYHEISNTLECAPCQYKTARRFCFVRHLQSSRHQAKMQAEIDALEQRDCLEQVDEFEVDNGLEEFDDIGEISGFEEADALEERNGVHEFDVLDEIDGEVQTAPGFEVIEHALVEENVYEEIVYLPTEDSLENCCFITLNND